MLKNYHNYTPIDWQKDFKSGYRFSAKKWYKNQRKYLLNKHYDGLMKSGRDRKPAI